MHDTDQNPPPAEEEKATAETAAPDNGGGEKTSDEKTSDPNGHPAFKVFDRRFWQRNGNSDEDEAPRADAPSYVQELRDQLAEKDKKLREYIAAYKKEVVEELEQTRGRIERDQVQQLDQMRGELATPMMEVLEAIERSLEAARSTHDVDALIQGIEMVQMLMVQKLKDVGLDRIETEGQRFDPQRHEAIAIVPVDDPAQDGTIVREFSPGFSLGERIIRAPRVQVAKHQS